MFSLKTYKTNEGYLGKIDTTDLESDNSVDLHFIVILDQSGSMGNSVPRFTNTILPMILTRLNMTTANITLITFSDKSEVYTGDKFFFSNLNIRCQGCTYMQPAVRNLEKLLDNLYQSNSKKHIRLLSVSDGCLHDQNNTLQYASSLFLKVKDKFIINSQAVRLFTSSSEPDTRGLSSMLQLNTIANPQLVDIGATQDVDLIADLISNLFIYDGMNYKINLKSSDMTFRENPWDPKKQSIDLIKGENVFWLDEIPESLVLENGDGVNVKNKFDVRIEKCEDITLDNYRTILDKKIDYFMQKMKVLKVVNTDASKNEMNLIIQYFSEFENYLNSNSLQLDEVDNYTVKNRVRFLKKLIQKRNLSITNKMKEIQNNDKVNQLNSRQLADFLRNVEVTKDGKSLSRRGFAEGIEFDDVARQEVLQMAKHIDELKNINDEHHSISFYSTSTTLEGIRAVCEIAQDPDMLNNISAIDIIKLLNIVGVGCDSEVRNYTDPMIYRLKDIYLGCYVSLSDVLSASEYSNGRNNLQDFNTKKIIANVIPVFEDQRVHRFLLKYAPKLLEYTASIGMRRVLMEVPNTYEFLFEAGILHLCQSFNTNRSEAAIKLFCNFVESYEVAAGNHYHYLNRVIVDQMNEYKNRPELLKYHIFLDDNAITSMTTAFLHIIKQNQVAILPKILRHLFCHEVHKVVNKIIKNHENKPEFVQSMLEELLGIDYEKHGSKLPKMFEEANEVQFYDDYTMNKTKINQIFDIASRAMIIPFIPCYLEATLEDDPLTAIKNLKEYNEYDALNYLGINYDMEHFKFFAVIQALLYRRNDERMDLTTKTMKIIDLDDFENAQKMVKDYIREAYHANFEKRLAVQNKQCENLLEDELVQSMLYCEELETFKDGFTVGLTRGPITTKIDNLYSPAFEKLKRQMEDIFDMNDTPEIPLLEEKISIILLGRDDEDEIVWNNGNIYRYKTKKLNELLKRIDKNKWEIVNEIIKKRNIHIYRNDSNRHGHSNDKPSYWALGYKSLEEMFATVSHEEIVEYKRKHVNCCGLYSKK